MTRLTISLDDDLYALARAHAFTTKTSISKAIADLIRQPRETKSLAESTSLNFHPLSGFPTSKSDGTILTNERILEAIHGDVGPEEETMHRFS